MSAELHAVRHDCALTLTFSNPGQGNALNADIATAIVEALATAERDDSVTAVILTGANGTFCRGTELAANDLVRRSDAKRQMAEFEAVGSCIEAVLNCPKPVIASVEGAASGPGFSLAMACDLIVSADSALFSMPHHATGLTPDAGGSWFLARTLPRQLAFETIVFCKPLDARRLAALGLISRLVPDGEALDAALQLAEGLASHIPDSVERVKLLLREASRNGLAEHMLLEGQHRLERLGNRDAGK